VERGGGGGKGGPLSFSSSTRGAKKAPAAEGDGSHRRTGLLPGSSTPPRDGHPGRSPQNVPYLRTWGGESQKK